MDAPVSGGQIGAENGKLTIMCGDDTYNLVELKSPVIQNFHH